MQERKLIVDRRHEGLRLDKYLALLFTDISRTRVQELIKTGSITVNGKILSAAHHLKHKDLVEVRIIQKEKAAIPLVEKDIPVIFEDDDFIVVDKPCDLVVHPVGQDQASLIGALMQKGVTLSDVSAQRPGVVHRLDKATSGIMVLAKSNSAHLWLLSQFRKRQVSKEYRALVKGVLKIKKGEIDLPLKRLKYKPTMKVSFLGAKKSLTIFEVLKEEKGFSLLKLSPKTGRMHQLRVHLAFLGHPIVGDNKYKGPKAERLFLHSIKLGFFHPRTKNFVAFSSKLPISFEAYLK
ncbi:MAG: RluA family pseudouridine synthase [Candidatus Omnitrophica bacterium]|nr:RluA family pseudouridine synthase [Candidatus Omnitrophota bacterium]